MSNIHDIVVFGSIPNYQASTKLPVKESQKGQILKNSLIQLSFEEEGGFILFWVTFIKLKILEPDL